MRAPRGRLSPTLTATAGSKLPSSCTPRNARTTLLRSTNCRAITITRLIGIEKPMPSLPPELLAMAVFMPITSPRRLISGPPLLPGLIAASV